MTTPTVALPHLPVIDISPLLQHDASPDAIRSVDNLMGQACTDVGFFYIIGHGIPAELQKELQSSSAEFFSLDNATKQKVAMALGGKAWRGTMHSLPCAVAAQAAPVATVNLTPLQVGFLSGTS